MFEDFTDDYIVDPSQEYGLFIDWCGTCFQWENHKPTEEDWQAIKDGWYPGKAPADAVASVIRP